MIYTQFWFGKSDPRYRPIMVASKEVIEAAGHTYKLIVDDTPVRSKGEAAAKKDRALVYLASENPSLISFDADLLIKEVFLPAESGLYLESGREISYVIVNGASNIFADMIQSAKVDEWNYGDFKKYFPKDAGIIPKGTYHHFMFQCLHNKDVAVNKKSFEYQTLKNQLEIAESAVETFKQEIVALGVSDLVARIRSK